MKVRSGAAIRDLENARNIVDGALQAGSVNEEDLPAAFDFMKRSAADVEGKRAAYRKAQEQFSATNTTTGQAPAYIRGGLGDSKTDVSKRFSLSRAVTNVLNGKAQDGAEAEMIIEGRNQFQGAEGQIVIPDWGVRQMRNVYGTDSSLGNIDAAVTGLQTLAPGGLRAALHGQPLAEQLGAQVIDGVGGQTIVLPFLGRTNAAVSNEGDDVTSSADFQSVSLTPVRYSRVVEVSGLSLRTTPAAMDQVIMNDIEAAIVTAQDKQAFAAVQSNATFVSGTAGTTANDLAATDMEDIHNLVSGYMDATGQNQYPTLVVSRLGAKALNTGLSGSDTTLSERYATQTGAAIVPAVNIVDGDITSANAVGGTGTISGAGVVMAGDFSALVICRWSGVDLLVDPFSSSTKNNIKMVANAFSACGVVNDAFRQMAVTNAEITAA